MRVASQRHADALTLASWGFELIPVSKNKVPCIKRREGEPPSGHHRATSDLAQIDQWWGHEYPHANIGARPWRGHAVIDVDPRNGGRDSFNELTRGRFLPDTLVTLTGGGGTHYWFKLPEDRPTTHKDAAPGIDVKTHDNGWVAMPGSVHKSGRLYRFLSFREPAMLPHYLRGLVYKPEPVQPLPRVQYAPDASTTGLERYLVDKVAGAVEGTRHDMLMEASFSAWRECPHIIDELVQAARSAGLEDWEIEKTIRSTRDATAAEGRLAA